MNEASLRADRRARIAIAAIVGVGVLLRLLVVRSPGFPSDVATFQAWAARIAEVGPARFYEPGYFSDYPPGYLYILGVLGSIFSGEVLRIAVKAMSIPFDVAIALIAASLAWRGAGRGSAILAAALWMLAPGPVFAGPYWGQVDAVGTVPFLLALIFAGRGRWATAGAVAAVGAMVKPQFGLALIVVLAGAVFVWIRDADWRPPVRVGLAAAAIILALGLPFRAGPAELVDLVRSASETYPFTSLYAFNIWSIVGDFWKPDAQYVVLGAILLLVGLAASCALLWWRRDVAAFLACGALAAMAFYFLPTRAHERYLFPAFALLLPLAAVRARLLVPYMALAISFAVSLYFAFTRYPQNDLQAPAWLEETLFVRNGQIALAVLMLGLAGYIAWRLARADAALEADEDAIADEEPTAPSPARPLDRWRLPAALSLGSPPTRRDIAVAFLVALVVLVTRGYRLDHPRDMYFDEVYHARTAFELLAEREPYEWTHPHLAKEIMALGILAFGDDRVVGTDPGVANAVAFTVGNDGTRVYAAADGTISVFDRDGRGGKLAQALAAPRALALDDRRLYLATDVEACSINVPAPASLAGSAGRPFDKCAALPQRATTIGLSESAGRVAVLTSGALYIYPALDAPPQTIQRTAVAMTAKPDGSTLYALEANGTVHVIDALAAKETETLNARGPASAIAYAQSANRLFLARADTPAIDVLDLEAHSSDTVPLANGRTGAFAVGASALALVPRTQFLYALTPGKVVVIETHGASPFAAIPVRASARALGVDGEDDKLLVAGTDTVERIETGRHALAWRIPGVLSAAILAFFLYLLARRLFASPVIAYAVAAAVVLDGSMFAQARIGMNDIYVTTFIVGAWYFIAAAHKPRRSAALDLVIAGVLIGLGAASKWAAIYTLVGIFVGSLAVTAWAYERDRAGRGGPLDLFAGRGRNAALLFACFAVIPAILYLGSYRSWFGGPTAPYGWNLVELTQQMYWYHSSLTAPHCAGSPWWAWPLDLKPVYWYFGASTGNFNGYIYDAGNPILFWVALPAAAIVVGLACRMRSAALGLVALAMLTQYLAWIPISRVLFFYHFFTALPFYLLCLAIVVALIWERRRSRVVAYGALVVFAFLFFYPYTSGVPVPGELGGAYQILPTWQYDPTFYPTDSCPTPVQASTPTTLTLGVAWLIELATLCLGAAIAFGFEPARRLLARVGVL